ncbi:hypothetical protein [Saccharothrix sp. ST-888]|uniref:hypothetical protein n=1 Tax=Saccharothrix sp. ST-888 TaxID=1427391 RepID=UPI0005EC8608|nr:hypothetical protein [Saccharothrix sp. ST-888]KJK58379.1 hypothetical protein UK12_10695 [Saccharothrix sp. ST-888]
MTARHGGGRRARPAAASAKPGVGPAVRMPEAGADRVLAAWPVLGERLVELEELTRCWSQ